MRLVNIVSLALLIGLAGSALADKNAPEKPWHYNYGLMNLNVVPEQDPNDTCNPTIGITDMSGVLDGDMTLDNDDYDPGPGGCADGRSEAGVDVAYRMDLAAGEVVDMTYNTPNFDASFYVVTDCSNVAGTCIIGADAGYDTEVIHWVVPEIRTYYLILDHYGTNQGAGPWSLTYSIATPVFGACCVCPGNCYMMTQEQCEALGGIYFGDDSNCSPPIACLWPPRGACCVNYVCTIESADDCNQMGGTYYGPCVHCDPTPCPPPTPIANSSWGRIKASYR